MAAGFFCALLVSCSDGGGSDAPADAADDSAGNGGAHPDASGGGQGGGGDAGAGGALTPDQGEGPGGSLDAAGGTDARLPVDVGDAGADTPSADRPDLGAGGGVPPDARRDDVPLPVDGGGRCHGDAECPLDQYCGPAGACLPGCQDAPGSCPPDALGRTRVCDLPTRTCVDTVACCSGENLCAVVRADACDGVAITGSPDCAAEPCGPTCLSDADCAADRFCHPVDFRCTLGCRVGVHGICPTDTSCDAVGRECASQDCAAHDDCADPEQYCDFIGVLATRTCLDGCRDSAACGPSGQCGADHVCVYLCDAEHGCPIRQVCDELSGHCVPICELDDDCPPTQVCDALSSRCVDGCRADDFEPDDVVAEARALAFSAPDADGLRHAEATGRMCELNPDVFAIDLPENGRFHAVLDFAPGAQTFIAVFSAEAEYGGDQPFAEPPGELTFPPLGAPVPPGSYYVRITSESAGGSDYTLSVTLAEGDNACFPDGREPDDGTWADATRIAVADATLTGSACLGDEDWFVVRMARNEGFALTLIALTGGAPVVGEMFRGSRVDVPDAAPDYITGEGVEGFDGTTYTLDVPSETHGFSDEDWYLRIRAAEAGGQAEYRALVAHRSSLIECDDDQHTEPNDDTGQAVLLDLLPALGDGDRIRTDEPLQVPMNLSLCLADRDVFCLIADRDDSLSAWIEGDSGGGVQWLDSFGDPLTALITGAVNRLGRVTAGRYCALVGGGAGPYTLFVQRDAPGVFLCAADPAESDPATGHRNDTAAEATLVPPAGADPRHFAIDTGYLCDLGETMDEDWYRFTPDVTPARLCVTVTGFAGSGGDVDLELFLPGSDQAGPTCATDDECEEAAARCVEGTCLLPSAVSATRYDDELISRGRFAETPGTGEHFLRVTRGQPPGEGIGYRVDVSLVPDAPDCGPDAPERVAPNDSEETATPLGRGGAGLCETWICPDERGTGDYYSLQVPAGEDRTVFIDYDAENDGRLYLYGTAPPPDPEDFLSGYVRSEMPAGGQQCINIRGGAEEQVVALQVVADRMLGNRVDYVLRVAPTDLAARPRGECIVLGATDLAACPPRSEWEEFPGFGRLQPDGCWASLDLP